MAKGIKPIVHNWPGAENQFKGYVFNTVAEAVEMMAPESTYRSISYRMQIEVLHSAGTYNLFKQLMLEIMGKTHTSHKLDWVTEFPEDIDVYLLSYPKTGRTWIRLFLQLYIGLCYDHQKTSLIGNLFYPAKLKKPRIFLTHTLLNYQPKNGAKTVVMVRDPKDILVSSYFHNTRRSYSVPKDYPIGKYIRDPASGIDLVLDWYRKTQEKLEKGGQNFLISYEDLHSNPKTAFRELIEFIGLPVDEGNLKKCIKGCDFKTLKNNMDVFKDHPEKQRYWAWDEKDPESHKFRRGKVGGYKDYLSEEDIAYIDARMANAPGLLL
jgi:alcohol sulfotransferase